MMAANAGVMFSDVAIEVTVPPSSSRVCTRAVRDGGGPLGERGERGAERAPADSTVNAPNMTESPKEEAADLEHPNR